MQVLELGGLAIDGVASCVPRHAADNLAACRSLFGDAAKAEAVVAATGIRARRLAAPGVTPLDLCVTAAERLISGLAARRGVSDWEIRRAVGGCVFVTFTGPRQMPANACAAQARLRLAADMPALDLSLACAGYGYGLFVAGSLAKSTGRPVLLLDGDVQSAVTDPNDPATASVFADAGSATLVGAASEPVNPWRFAFLTRGEEGEALALARGGTIRMDGFGVYRFVATDVARFLRAFLAETGRTPDDFDAFVPHQANVYMIRQLAKAVGLPEAKLRVSAETLGNSGSASVPVTLSRTCVGGSRLLLAGFGAGLAASVADVSLAQDAFLESVEEL